MKCEEIDSLQGLIMRMTHLYYGKAYAAMKELDVHPRQIPLLFILQKKEGMSQREICDEMKIKPPTVAVSIKRMEKAGLIEKMPDEKDQRVVRIYVTEKGKSLSKQIEKVVKESEAKVVEGFSEVEICLMKRFLKQMISNMEQEESKKE